VRLPRLKVRPKQLRPPNPWLKANRALTLGELNKGFEAERRRHLVSPVPLGQGADGSVIESVGRSPSLAGYLRAWRSASPGWPGDSARRR
jgi:hypothetical protein